MNYLDGAVIVAAQLTNAASTTCYTERPIVRRGTEKAEVAQDPVGEAEALMECGMKWTALAVRRKANGVVADSAAPCPAPIRTMTLGGAPCPRAFAPRNE